MKENLPCVHEKKKNKRRRPKKKYERFDSALLTDSLPLYKGWNVGDYGRKVTKPDAPFKDFLKENEITTSYLEEKGGMVSKVEYATDGFPSFRSYTLGSRQQSNKEIEIIKGTKCHFCNTLQIRT